MNSKVVAIVGSYRKDGVVDHAVAAVLAGARERGAETHIIHLTEQQIEFCTNCRQCCQTPGAERGKCQHNDAMESILAEIENADAVVLASPVNYYNATALFRRFLERLLGFNYWPWGKATPQPRNKWKPRKAVLIASAGMPGFLIPIFTGTAKALKLASHSLGAEPVGKLWIGLSAMTPHHELSARTRKQAHKLGLRLA
jgi:multimeric flavodoxin WrbA